MSDEPSVIIDEAPRFDLEVPVIAPPPPPPFVAMCDRWPTTAEFVDRETQDEAISIAATVILTVQKNIIKAVYDCNESPLPAAIKGLFNKKMRSGMSQMYAAIPGSTLQEMVEMVVMTELAGGPEKLAEIVAAQQAELTNGAVDDKVSSSGTVNSVPSGQEASSASGATILQLPVPEPVPEQWAVQLGADNKLHIAQPEPELPPGVIPLFKKPEPPTPGGDGPSGGSPVMARAA